jgi:ribonucleoside-diphosphate reductase alpha chain
MRWLNDLSRQALNNEDGYLLPGETISDRIDIICAELENANGVHGFAGMFKENLEKGWYCLSSPFWSNLGRKNALPFSCFNSHIDDDMGSILFALSEVGMMTKVGGGTSGYFGDVRGKGASIQGKYISQGSKAFAKDFENITNSVSQGFRRGYFAGYWPADHPDILDVLEIGRDNDEIQRMNYGVCITDEWIAKVKSGDSDKRKVWTKIIESRIATGMPYIFFTDNVNHIPFIKSGDSFEFYASDVYAANNMKVNGSNLCSEITEVSNDKYSFLCDLAAMNLLYYDEWKDTNAVEILVYALDALHTIFQNILEEWRDSENLHDNLKFRFLEKTYNSSVDFRDIGIGATGLHSLFQSKNVAFGDIQSRILNKEIFLNLGTQVDAASEKLATEFGEPKMLKGFGRRNGMKMAIAPNTTSAFILGQVSQGIEPIFSNYYLKDVANSKHVVKNPILIKLLESKDENSPDVWKSILKHNGSVQHLDFLTPLEKDVFKTFDEISQLDIIQLAADRQQYIDQSQSLNLKIPIGTNPKEISDLLFEAHRLGIKTLYYQHSFSAAQEFRRNLLTCTSCEG